jgi:hypothetical protein
LDQINPTVALNGPLFKCEQVKQFRELIAQNHTQVLRKLVTVLKSSGLVMNKLRNPLKQTEKHLRGNLNMSGTNPRSPDKNPGWFYPVLALQTFVIIIVIGMLKDLIWIL